MLNKLSSLVRHSPRHPEHSPRHPERSPRHPERSEGSPPSGTISKVTWRMTLLLISIELFLVACSPIKTPIAYQYKLDSYSAKPLNLSHSCQSILITMPEAAAGYQSSEMLYVKKPFELSSFANNAWIDQPAKMLLPLLVQSLQYSGHFYAVTSSANSEHTDYRLDTQLIELQQNFLQRPSRVDLVAKFVLTHVSDNRVVASRLISEHVNCPMGTPYGGVIAANRATYRLTAQASEFVISRVKRDICASTRK